jgi:dCMP deaminase
MVLPRCDWDSYWMTMAHVVATRSTCSRGPELRLCPGRRGTGAVLVAGNTVIATGYNGSPPGLPHCDDVGHEMVDGHCQRVVHSETNAVLQCARLGIAALGSTCYVTTLPCYKCLKELARVGVYRILYDASYGDGECLLSKAREMGLVIARWEMPEGVSF